MPNFYTTLDAVAAQPGILVQRATSNLPATAALNIFTVTGGRIMLVSLILEVTTIIQALACTIKFTSTPTTGSAIDLSAVSASISALEVGGRVSVPSPPAAATAAVVTNAGYTVQPSQRVIVPAGTISYTTSATVTGQMKAELIYVLYDTGVTVAAA